MWTDLRTWDFAPIGDFFRAHLDHFKLTRGRGASIQSITSLGESPKECPDPAYFLKLKDRDIIPIRIGYPTIRGISNVFVSLHSSYFFQTVTFLINE